MWFGVCRGFAGLKFSGSKIIKLKEFMVIIIRMIKRMILVKSFLEKKFLKEILSLFEFKFMLFDEPMEWRSNIWIVDRIIKVSGKMKWIEKNRFKVGFETLNPPHSQWVNLIPIIGIVDKRFVITVAPHNDICPHGRTYPMKAEAIKIKKMVTPDDQVKWFLNDLFWIPRIIWRKIRIKNVDAPVECINFRIKPWFRFREISIYELNARRVDGL